MGQGGGGSCCCAWIGAIADLWILISAGLTALPAYPSARPFSAGLTLSKAAFSDLCHCHQASAPWPAVYQMGDLAFCFSEKIEAFRLHPVSERVDLPHTSFGSLEPQPGVMEILPSPTPHFQLGLCFHNKHNSFGYTPFSPFLLPLNTELWQSPIFWKVLPSDLNAFRHR